MIRNAKGRLGWVHTEELKIHASVKAIVIYKV